MPLEETIDNQKSFLRAISGGRLHIVKYLISSEQASVNMKDENDIPALQIAIRKGRLEIAHHLLQRKGINLDAIDADGNSALHDAALYDCFGIMKLLIEKGCDVMLQNNMCELPIDLTDDHEMQEMICRAMDSYGYVELASQYRTYLNLTPAHSSALTEPDCNYPACAAIAPEVINYSSLHKSSFTRHAPLIHQSNLPVSSFVARAKPTLFEEETNTFQQIASYSQLVQVESMDSDNDSSYSSDNDQCRNMLTDINSDNVLTENNSSGIRTVEQALMNLKIAFTGSDNSTCVDETSDQVNTCPPVVRRPRKSSLATFDSRKLSDGRRKSVSFQPEVLLQQIVTEGDVEEIKDVLSSGVDINRMSPAGLTALHQAAMDGNVECAQALLLNGGDVNVTDCEGCTPLHTAAICGNAEFVHFLLAAGADPFLKTDDGQVPIQLAEEEKIKKLIRNAMNGKVFDFLYEYATSDVESEVSETEEQGGYVDDDEYSGEENESEDLDMQKNVTVSVSSDDSAVFNNNRTNIFGSTFPTLRPRQPISSCSSCDSNETEVAEEPCSTGTCRREHPRADSESNPPCLEVPVTEAEANHYASEDQGISTMDGSSDGCARKGRSCSEDEDLSHKVDPDLVPNSKDYIFQEAVLNCNIEALVRLHKHQADINVNRINRSGITALHHAVLEENFALVQHLVKYFNADVQIRDTDGWSPLHAASAVGDLRTAQFLLENGAKASQLNNNCEFPVDLAQDQAMEQLLKNAMLGPTVGKLFTGVLTRNA